MSKWQPIATAPKDGTIILAYRPDQGVFTAHFVSASAFLGMEDDGEPQWWTTDGGDISSANLMPTHWMPLPAPPEDNAP